LFNAGDNAWVLMSSALVLMMTAPALALFYSGLVRRKNVLSVIMQCVFPDVRDERFVWALYGYSAGVRRRGARGSADLRYLFMQGAQFVWTSNGPDHPPGAEAHHSPSPPTCCSRGCSSSSRRR